MLSRFTVTKCVKVSTTLSETQACKQAPRLSVSVCVVAPHISLDRNGGGLICVKGKDKNPMVTMIRSRKLTTRAAVAFNEMLIKDLGA